MEFFDNFEDFECEQSSSQQSKQYPPFSPCIQNSNWFLNGDYFDPETQLYRAVSFFDKGLVFNALQIFQQIHQTSKNNRFHEIMLLDSMLQCYIKIESANFSESKCADLLTSFENLLVDFGDQIQFLKTKSEVLTRFSSSSELLDTVSLLCALSDLPENWLLFLGVDHSENFKLCILTKCLMGYEAQINHAHGFVQNSISRKIEKVQKQINDITKDTNTIVEIREKMSSYQKTSVEENQQKDFKAHDCRVKNRFVANEEKSEILQSFKSRYSYLFSCLE